MSHANPMRVEQAIYTSLARDLKSGYHVVSRSRGVSEADARALAAWAPSNGALMVDDANRVSVNFHPLPEGRFALTRTCEGLPEYSGRGGRQLYTHALIFTTDQLDRSSYQTIPLYRDALSLGHARYRVNPEPILEAVPLSECHGLRDPAYWRARASDLGARDLPALERRLRADEPVRLHYPGDRILLTECLLGILTRDLVASLSFSTSLRSSSVRPYRLSLLQ
jgi:GTPase-associated protein 1, N-terminal domain type 2